jgi:GTP pyrophosphokinase
VVREDEPERIVPVSWGKVDNASYPVTIRIEAADREGLLRDVATVVANDGINLSAANVSTTPGNTAIISATLDLKSIDQLSQVLGKIERVRDVISVARIGIGS